MKKIALSAASLVALSTSVFAADLPSRKEPVIAPPPPPMWTGFYVGVTAGGNWANNNSVNVTTWPFSAGNNGGYWTTASQATGSVSTGNSGGFIGGGQIGYNWQIPYSGMNFVSGIEADFQGTTNGGGSGRGLFSVIPVGADGTNLSSVAASNYLSWIGTVRGRLGYLVTPTLLVYGTGGLAYGQVNESVRTFQSLHDHEVAPFDMTLTSTAFGATSRSSTAVGWTAGGGAEWMFMPNWSAKAEYLYYDLGNTSSNTITTGLGYLNGAYIGAKTLYSTTANSRINGNIVRAGVNYHFNWGLAPVVAKY